VVAHFVDIGGTVDHHCLNSIFNAVLHFMVTVGSSIKRKTRTECQKFPRYLFYTGVLVYE
jgi:hypothetical protein